MRRIIGAIATALAGLLLAFFFVFNALFSDGPASPVDREYLVAYTLILVGYGASAYVAGRWGGWRWWTVAWLATPAVAIIVLYPEPSLTLRGLVFLALAIGTGGGLVAARRTWA